MTDWITRQKLISELAAVARLAVTCSSRPGQRTGRDDRLTHACLLDDGQPVMRAALRDTGQASGCRPAPALRR